MERAIPNAAAHPCADHVWSAFALHHRHGIIGQSWDGDGLAVDGQLDAYPNTEGAVFTTYSMAEGAIEGSANDYEVGSPYEVQFKYSRFGTSGVASRNKSMLATCFGTKPSFVAGATEVGPGQVGCRGSMRLSGCVDTPRAFVGLQPRIPLDCPVGLVKLSLLLATGAKAYPGGENIDVTTLCRETTGNFTTHIAPLGIAYVIPSGFTLQSTWADVCPDTCRSHGVFAACIDRMNH